MLKVAEENTDKPKYCQVCVSKDIIVLNSSIYCEKCGVYYQVEEDNQYVSAIPVSEIDQICINLCTKCSKIKESSKRIRCTNFADFLRKLRICKECKVKNNEYIKNLYYRNFIMYKQKTYVYGKVYKGIYLIFFLISLIKQKRVTNIVTGFVQWLLAKSHFPGASKPFNFILVKLNDCLNWTMKLEQLIIEENSAMFRRLSRVIYSNAFVQYLYTTIPTALSNNVVFSRIINALFMLMIRSKLLLFKGKAKVAEKLEELYTAASETPNSRIQRKIYAFLSMVFYSMSTRHVMYIWYGWLKLESLTIYSAIGLAIFGCNRFLLVDIYVFLSGFMHLYESTQIYYEIPENLNRAAELNEFLKKITFKKIYNTNKRANSMPDLTDNRSATRYY